MQDKEHLSWPHLFAIGALAVLLGLAIVLQPGSTYSSPAKMDAYFGGELSPNSWAWEGSWSKSAEPFKYRILFRYSVDFFADSLTAFLPKDLTTYWYALVTGLLISISFSLVALELLLRECNYKPSLRSILLIVWFLFPPIHHAFLLPVQTKEDFLAYGIFFLGIRSILKNDLYGVLFWTILAALTRETLLILPLVFFLVSCKPLSQRVLPLICAVALQLGIRILMGTEGYQVLRNENFETALTIPMSIFLILGFGWVGLFTLLLKTRIASTYNMTLQSLKLKNCDEESGPPDYLERLVATLPIVFILVLITHLLMGRIVEIRISALLAPWALIGIASLLQGRPLRFRIVHLIVPTLVLVAIVTLELSGFGTHLRDWVNPRIIGFKGQIWWLELYMQATLVALLVSFSMMPRANKIKCKP